MVLLKISKNSWYLGEILKRSEAFASFAKLVWMFEEWKQSWSLLKPRSFNICINATILIIAMLGYLEIDMKILNADIETTESDNCKEVS